MRESTKTVNITKINSGAQTEITDEIIVEEVLNIYVNRRFYTSLMCTPNEMLELAIGFLFAEETISSMDDISGVEEICENSIGIILKYDLEEDFQKRKALTSGCAKSSINLDILEKSNIKPIESNYKFNADEILSMMKEFNGKSELFKETGGVHSCAICSSTEIIFFSEDIGRHNALDKVIGKALINNVNLDDKLLMTTGRISSDIAIKAARASISVIVSHSAPTDMALNIAKTSNITMAGFARGKRMSVYCGKQRIIL